MELKSRQLTDRIIGLAIEVHRGLGPGLLESTYEECLSYELMEAGIPFARQVALPLSYKAVRLDCGYRMDMVVDEAVIVELKSVENRLSGLSMGLILNFNSRVLKEGLRRMVL